MTILEGKGKRMEKLKKRKKKARKRTFFKKSAT